MHVIPRFLLLRRLAILVATTLFSLAALNACGPKAPLMRRGDTWSCVQEASKGGDVTRKAQGHEVFAWVSLASPDRWIAIVDALGQRAGTFAPGSSVRDRAMQDLTKYFDEIGIKSVKWLDPSRPLHVLLQAPSSSTDDIALVLPTLGEAEIETQSKQRSAGGAYLLRDDEPGVLFKRITPFTALVASGDRRLGWSEAPARCVQHLRPRRLLEGGVKVAELLNQHPHLLDEALDEFKDQKIKNKELGGWLTDWSQAAFSKLKEMEVLFFRLDANKKRFQLDLTLRARPNTDLARRFKTDGERGPNPLLRLLPAESWAAIGASGDPAHEERGSSDLLRKLAKLAELPGALEERVQETLVALGKLSLGHNAAAIYLDGDMRFGMQWIFDSSDARRQTILMTDLLRDLLVWGAQKGADKAKLKEGKETKTAQEAELFVTLARAQGWPGIAKRLCDRSKGWPVHIQTSELSEGGLRCHGLDIKIGRVPKRQIVVSLLGDHFTLALCTTRNLGMLLMGPNAYAQAKRIASGKGPGLTETKLYQNALSDHGEGGGWRGLLNPAPILDMARALSPRLPQWPKDRAISGGCSYAEVETRCQLRVPTDVLDIVATVLGERGR